VLQRHAAAVLEHSRGKFLADVDTASSAAGFRDRQAAQLAALAEVPLASWTYAVDAQVTDAGAAAAATKRYGAPAVIVRVALAYRLQGIDDRPSTHELWWTFVRRSGHTVIAGDDDLARSGGASWRGPWDFGPLTAARAGGALALGHPGAANSLPGIARAAAAAIPAVTDVVGSDWAQKVAVFVPSTDAEFSALSGGVGSTDVSAVTVFDDPGAARLARIVVRPNVLRTLSGVGLQIVLRHELTHVATASTTTPITPRWLIEGFAEYVGNRNSGQPIGEAAAELAQDVRRGSLPSALPADSAFGATGAAVERTYEQSWLACVVLANRLGPHGLAQLYVAVGRATAPNDTAFALVLQDRLGMTLPAFVTQWRDYLRTELG
jgi:hypothetical protein